MSTKEAIDRVFRDPNAKAEDFCSLSLDSQIENSEEFLEQAKAQVETLIEEAVQS